MYNIKFLPVQLLEVNIDTENQIIKTILGLFSPGRPPFDKSLKKLIK
jgi:hypothetical protein